MCLGWSIPYKGDSDNACKQNLLLRNILLPFFEYSVQKFVCLLVIKG